MQIQTGTGTGAGVGADHLGAVGVSVTGLGLQAFWAWVRTSCAGDMPRMQQRSIELEI